MTTDKVMQLESDYLSGMAVNLELAKGKLLRGSRWQMIEQDDADLLRNLMARHRQFDRRLLSAVPKNRRLVLHSYKRPWWWFGKRHVGVAVASVLSPLDWYVREAQCDNAGPPIGSRELLDHVQSLRADPRVPHVIGVCSPTGFTPEALAIRADLSNVILVLIEPGPTGGWRVHGGESLDRAVLALFDPEDRPAKAQRVETFLRTRGAELLTGGVAVSQAARELALDEDVVERAFQEVARTQPELHVTRQQDELLIYRGAASSKQERTPMSMVDRIRQLFNREGDESQKINELSQRRAALSQRRNRLYDDIAQLEKREADLLEQGRQNRSQVVRRRIAAQLAQLRKDIQRQNTTASMLNKQIDILSTDIHNLTLIQQGEVARLPSSEELTENAVKAEEMLETLNTDADLVNSLETGMATWMTSAEERAILDEFEQIERAPAADAAPSAANRTASAEPPSAAPPMPEPPDSAGPRRLPPQKHKEPEAS